MPVNPNVEKMIKNLTSTKCARGAEKYGSKQNISSAKETARNFLPYVEPEKHKNWEVQVIDEVMSEGKSRIYAVEVVQHLKEMLRAEGSKV